MDMDTEINLIPVFRAALEAMGVDYSQENFSEAELVRAQAALRFVDNLIETEINRQLKGEDDATD
tara:strand:+ start:319 stop:513 length:195 start_codon:yes stop_codon:yes gene_type:complete